MTGYTVHTGSTEKFAEGWDQIFKVKGKKRRTAAKKPAAKKSAAASSGDRSRKRGKTN